jgi:Raf kinase inhibitor-like YbhB/YbcL family protein
MELCPARIVSAMADQTFPPLQYDFLPEVPSFTLVSDDITEGEPMALPQASGMFGIEGGTDTSPHLRWDGAPEGTKSYAVTCFDPDAPTGSGFWHWGVFNLPPDVTELPAGAGSQDGANLPAGAVQIRNDANVPGFVGAAPPPGRVHRYVFAVHALDVEQTGVDANATNALAGFLMYGHVIARAVLTATYSR